METPADAAADAAVPPRPARRRGRTTLLIAAALVLGALAGTALRFHASGFADVFTGCSADMNLNGVNRIETDDLWGKARVAQAAPTTDDVTVLEESVPFGDEQIRAGCVQSGDVQAVILQSRKGATPAVPLHQAVILQGQLLG
ncbi:hypothetical protein ACFYN3_26900 [Streptomyces lavendulae]|uniref:hypothetical protein n=1 Tax=Streptomyces lavendulae TaxID=1914 RepID=UPI003696CB5F